MTEFKIVDIPMSFPDDRGFCVINPMATAAVYLSWVAYPSKSQDKRAERFINVFRAMPYKAQSVHTPKNIPYVRPSDSEGIIKDAFHLIRHRRYPAQWMATKLLGFDERHPIGSLTVQKAADLLCCPFETIDPDEGAIIENREPKKVTEFVWRESLPALAMIMALPKPKKIAKDWLTEPHWVPETVLRAIEIAEYLSTQLKIKTLLVPKLVDLPAYRE